MKLTLLRHAETEENVHHIIQGQKPGHLSEFGKQQAIEIAEELKNTPYDAIYSSDLKRCADTAEYIHKHHRSTPLIYEKALREVSFGRFEGMPAIFSKLGLKIGARLNLKAPGGENWHDLQGRVVPFINQLYAKYPNGSVLVVTHGGPIRLLKPLLDKNLSKTSFVDNVPNCLPWEIVMNGPIKI